MSFAQHLPTFSKACFKNIRYLRLIRNSIDQNTVCTIASYLIHSKIVYCNSLLLNLPATQINHLQLVLNLLLVLPHKLHNTPILESLHWLKLNEKIKYKVLSLSQINLSKLVNLLISALFFHSIHIIVLSLLLVSLLVALLSPLVLKLQHIFLSFCSCFVELFPI